MRIETRSDGKTFNIESSTTIKFPRTFMMKTFIIEKQILEFKNQEMFNSKVYALHMFTRCSTVFRAEKNWKDMFCA